MSPPAAWAAAARHPVELILRRRSDLDSHRADSRVSEYVYGDVLVLAATAGVYRAAIASGQAVLVVLGTVASTYVAHVVADVVGAVFGGRALWPTVRAELRDSVPVLSAGAPSCALVAAAALGWPAPGWAQALAIAVLIGRLATIGLVYRRLHPTVTLHHAVSFGVLAAAAATAAAALKLLLAH